MPQRASLRVEDLHAYYGHAHVLQGVSLEIAAGRIAAVLGRNGVGKTTTLRAMLGLIPVRRGRVLLGDRDVAGWPPHRIVRLGIGYVPEGRVILPDLTVVENVAVAQRTASPQWPIERLFTLFPALAERRRSKARSFRAVSSRCSHWRARLRPIPRSCCSTSPRRDWRR